MLPHEYYETKYLFVYFYTKEKGWQCKISTEYSEGEYWHSKATNKCEYPNKTFLQYQKSFEYIEVTNKRHEFKKMLSKENTYNKYMKGLFKGQVLKLEIGTYIKEVFENDLFSGIKEQGCKREL